jgi:large subunit ribosomal protein L11
MPERKVVATIRLQIRAGSANPGPPVGPALGQYGINTMAFCRLFNAKTQHQAGTILPTVITIFSDRSFNFHVKTPPAVHLLKIAAGIAKGAEEPKRETVGTITRGQLREIAEMKREDLNAHDISAAERTIAGTARSMGIKIEG